MNEGNTNREVAVGRHPPDNDTIASWDTSCTNDLMRCPSLTTLQGLAASRPSDNDADRMREHLDLCPHCREAMCRVEPTEGTSGPSSDPPETAHEPASSRTMTYGVPAQTKALPPGCEDPPDLAALTAAGWRFAGNVAEREGPESPRAAGHPRLDVLSRDPSDPRFLRPAAGSLLATAGLGGEWPSYVGVCAPTP